MPVLEMSDKALAKRWRKGAIENQTYSDELKRRGYKFSLRGGMALTIAAVEEIRIIKQKTIEL